MASWLTNPKSERYVDQLRSHYACVRGRVQRLLIDELDFPDHAVFPGTCMSYLRFQVPPRFTVDQDEERYRGLSLAAGVLPGCGSMTNASPEAAQYDRTSWVRVHLGHPAHVLNEALDRLRAAGLGWN